LSQISFRVLGVRIDALRVEQAVRTIETWIAGKERGRLVSLTNIHGVIECQRDPKFGEVLEATSLSLPDGMPLVWVARLRGIKLRRRIPGPDLMWEFCRATHEKGYSHFFYGGAEGVPERLAEVLTREFPGLRVAGAYSPPFRPLTPEEDRQVVERINRAAPDVLWVGLGCPKQEYWMYQHRNRLNVPVILAVGQAFDVHAGRTRRAPAWMGDHGLEWLFRLWQEPRRLWRRYLIYNTEFMFRILLDWVGFRKS